MSEPTTPVDGPPAEAGRPDETPEQTIAALREALQKANAQAKEHRERATELDKAKAALMGDLEKASAALGDSQKATQEAASAATRWKVAATHGVSAQDAEVFLTASDEAGLVAQAERLVELQGSKVPTNPLPDPSQGRADAMALNGDELEAALRNKLGMRA